MKNKNKILFYFVFIDINLGNEFDAKRNKYLKYLKKNIIKVIKTNLCLHMELNQLMGFSKVDMT